MAESARDLVEYVSARFRGKKFLWYPGGDWYIKDKLLSALARAPCRRCVLVEVFGGSGVVSQYAPRSRFYNIVYNDRDRQLVELIRFVKERPDVLAEVLSVIPFSREVHDYICSLAGRYSDELKGLLAAVFMFYAINTSFNGEFCDSFAASKREPKASIYASKVSAVLEASKRFRDVVVECLDFEEAIARYDSEETVFYLDPPYVSVNGGRDYYRFGFTMSDVARLVNALNRVKGYFLLKVHADQLPLYSRLRYVSRQDFEVTLNMGVKKEELGESRDKWKLVLLANYRLSNGLPVG